MINHNADGEGTPLLGGNKKTSSRYARLKAHMRRDIDIVNTDLLMFLGFFITGILDSAAILVFESFVSMQTGNSVYIGIGLADPTRSNRWVKAAISLGFFCFGSFAFGWYHRLCGTRRRWVLAGSFALQALLILVAAVVLHTDDKSDHTMRWQVILGIALVATSAGAQAVSSRAVELSMLSTVVLTNIYCDLFMDAKLFTAPTNNVERNQRAAATISLLCGAVVGGTLGKSWHGVVLALWIAFALKIVLMFCWLFWKPAKEED